MSVSPRNMSEQGRETLVAELALERQWLLDARRDPEHFQFFYQKYADRIHRFIRTRTGSEERAKDLTAVVFTRALAGLPQFKWRDVPLGSWFYRIASNVIQDSIARQARLNTHNSETTEDTVPDPKAGQLTRLINGEKQQVLYECLHALPEEDQDIFILYYWEGLKTREVAEAMNMSENTVKTRLKRGRQQLRGLMESRQKTDPATENGTAASLDPDLRFSTWAPAEDED